MSEDLSTYRGQTNIGQNSTQPELTPLSNFNFSISIQVTIDQELVAALQKISSYLDTLRSEQVPVPVEKTLEVIEKIPVKKQVYGRIEYGETGWNKVPKYKNFRWRQDGDKLILKYYAGEVITTWQEIERLKALNLRQLREEINKISTANNKKTAVRVFIECFEKGIIKKPVNPDAELEKNFSKFTKEEDPDAAFLPMLTSYSTKPDENCGKIEGTLEG